MAEEGTAHDRRTLRTLRSHLWLSGSIATLCFAVILGLSVFFPIAMQLGRADLASPEAYGLAQHFLFLHSALWPLVLLSLIASVVTAHVLFHRMREPLVRFMHCYQAISSGAIPSPIKIRRTDYLADETDELNRMVASLGRQCAMRGELVARLEEAITDLASRGVPESVLSELQDIAKRLSVSADGASRDASAG